jgi:hypothetical protein
MVEVGQTAVDENGINLKITAIIFNTIDYYITVEEESDLGPFSMPYIESDFNEKYGNLIWTTP